MRPGDGRGPDAYLSRQPYFQQMPRFMIHETAVHWIDTFRYLMGEPEAVFADLRRLNPAIAGEDAGYILFRFASGAAGLFDGNRLNDHVSDNTRRTMVEMWLEGSEGILRLDGSGRLWLKPHQGDERRHAYGFDDQGFGGDCVYRLQQHVIAHLQDGAPVENDAARYLRNVEIEEAVYRSAEEGRWITV
jgi:predicted dehydrogenase